MTDKPDTRETPRVDELDKEIAEMLSPLLGSCNPDIKGQVVGQAYATLMDFARQLERELAEANRKLAELEKKFADWQTEANAADENFGLVP